MRPFFLSSCLIAAGLFALAQPALADTVLFSDNFNSGASAAWGDQRGNWRASDGVYDATNPDSSPITYSDVTSLSGLTDFTVDVDVNGWDDGGIWLRSSFASGVINGVLLVTGGNTGSYQGMYWHAVTNNSFSGAASHLVIGGIQETDQHLKITVTGNEYKACVGSACSVFNNSQFAAGSVGLYDFSPTSGASSPRGQTFDNFTVTVVPEPSALLMLLSGLGLLGLKARRRV